MARSLLSRMFLRIVMQYVDFINKFNNYETQSLIEHEQLTANNTVLSEYFKVMVYNLNQSTLYGNQIERGRVNQVCQDLAQGRVSGIGPGIVLLQGVNRKSTYKTLKKIGYPFCYRLKPTVGLFNSGLCILSNFKIDNPREIPFHVAEKGFGCLTRKSAIVGSVDVGGVVLNIINTRFGTADMSIQKKHIYKLENIIKTLDEKPTLIGGDFNIVTGDDNYEFLLSRTNALDAVMHCNGDSKCIVSETSAFDTSTSKFLIRNFTRDIAEIYKPFVDEILHPRDVSCPNCAIVIKIKRAL